MNAISAICRLALMGGRRFVSWIKTAKARGDATIGVETRILSTGEIVNISRVRNRLVLGAKCVIAGQVLVFPHGGRIRIGDYVFLGEGSHIWSSAEIEIGNRVLISHGVEIHDTDSHPLNAKARAAHAMHIIDKGHPCEIDGIRAKPIRIGDDVWIGFGATIRKGVTIGDRSIIGARAIIEYDVPSDSMVKTPPTLFGEDKHR